MIYQYLNGLMERKRKIIKLKLNTVKTQIKKLIIYQAPNQIFLILNLGVKT